MSGRELTLLIVEDDAALREVLGLHLGAQPGWTVRAVGDGEAALAACAAALPDLVVLDVMLPGRSGLEVCAALRALYHPSPGVLMVTARADEVDVIVGFEVGADDFVIKPCRPREIVARLRALARRLRPETGPIPIETDTPSATAPSSVLHRGALSIDPASHKVHVDGRLVKLTPTELAMLLELAREPDVVHSRASLLARVFDTNHDGYARNVDCHVARLRSKLDAAGLVPSPIETVHGSGYRFVLGT
jgi:DNA-binding response OmpR family regulator